MGYSGWWPLVEGADRRHLRIPRGHVEILGGPLSRIGEGSKGEDDRQENGR